MDKRIAWATCKSIIITEWAKIRLLAKPHLLVTAVLLVFFLVGSAPSVCAEEDFSKSIENELNRIHTLIEKGKREQAEKALEGVKKKAACTNDPHEYCTAQYLVRSIFYLDLLLHGQGGSHKFRGKVTDGAGNTAGFFDVKSKKRKMCFIYDAYTTTAVRPSVGSVVTVFYNKSKGACHTATKVVVHRK